jgi:hypothetical protein
VYEINDYSNHGFKHKDFTNPSKGISSTSNSLIDEAIAFLSLGIKGGVTSAVA